MATREPIEKYFRIISFLVALAGVFALFASGGVGIILLSGFAFTTLLAWWFEGTKWQISERVALVLVVGALAFFVADWKFRFLGVWDGGIFAASGLSRLILFLSAVKLLQKKSDKDWIFIYLIAFFQVLLAAGLSISIYYIVSLVLFLLTASAAIVAFEIRKSARDAEESEADRSGIRRVAGEIHAPGRTVGRLPLISFAIIIAIGLVAVPIFFALPRSNAAGFSGSLANRVSVTGFSNSVRLGAIGTLQKNDATVMRVRIVQNSNADLKSLRWRGVALDKFDNKGWTKSRPEIYPATNTRRNYFMLLEYPSTHGQTTVQTVYLEPLNTNVLFALKTPYAIGGKSYLSKDAEGALLGSGSGIERSVYTVYSDTSEPAPDLLREDSIAYRKDYARYLQLPEDIDERIPELASKWITDAKASNRYDSAKAIENRLRRDFKYSLEMRAGGEQPVADFLFNVKAGHCEYFASAMAVMLRSQGIASRVVNGFSNGEFNETAGVYVVRQYDAHSWVEVYFPESNAWVEFDPTPPDWEQRKGGNSFFSVIGGYFEAIETFWIQYVVAYDGQEQQSLFRRFRDSVSQAADSGSGFLSELQRRLGEIVEEIRGDGGWVSALKFGGIGTAILLGGLLAVFLLYRIFRMIASIPFLARFGKRFRGDQAKKIIGFYETMTELLRKYGLERTPSQTPLEFAMATGFAEVVAITEAYHAVRFGERELTVGEGDHIESRIEELRIRLAETKA
ncbi:MAG: DUF3488 and transglutaminase-like domain-containing protein [Pyrinomonadaceae bacterium]